MRAHRATAAAYRLQFLAFRSHSVRQNTSTLRLQAIVSLVRQLVRMKHADRQALLMLDARVALGALGNGRSSNQRTNSFVLLSVEFL